MVSAVCTLELLWALTAPNLAALAFLRYLSRCSAVGFLTFYELRQLLVSFCITLLAFGGCRVLVSAGPSESFGVYLAPASAASELRGSVALSGL